MSGDMLVRAAVLTALRGDGDLAALVNSIDDGEPVKASAPWLRVTEINATSWGARGVDGMTVRLAILIATRGDEAALASDLLARVDGLLGAAPSALAEGWRITSLRRERTRVARRQNEWRASADYSIRIARLA